MRAPTGIAVRPADAASRPLQLVDVDVLAGGIGTLAFLRGDRGQVTGFDFGEPEDFGERLIRFVRMEPALRRP